MALLALVTLLPVTAHAQKKTLGIFLPTTLADGQERFQLGEKVAAALSASLGESVVSRSFGRYEDFAKAAQSGALDLALLDGWVAAQSNAKLTPLAWGVIAGETATRWAVVSATRGTVSALAGKRLAITRAVKGLDDKFVTNVVFGGELAAPRHFKLVPVPTVESALKMLDAHSADAALVPMVSVPKGMRVVYRSGKVPGVVVVSLKGDAPAQAQAFLKLTGMGPIEKFVAGPGTEIDDLKRLIVRGPPPKQPWVAESPLVRVDPAALVNFKGNGLVLPSFTEFVEVPKDQPDE